MSYLADDNTVYNRGQWVGAMIENVDSIAEPAMPPVGVRAVDEGEVAETTDGRLVLAKDYRTLRAAEYPSIGDQLDALYHAGLFPPEMAAAIESVKLRYQKV